MSWNYRIIKKRDKELKEDMYFLAEVFYEHDGSLRGYSEEASVWGSNKDEIIEVLNMMLKDAKKYPVLNEKEFYKKDKEDDAV